MKPASMREVATFAAIALIVVIVQLIALGAYELIARPLWFDECLTWLLASDASFTHEMRALAGGVDTNMPGLYVLLRPMRWIGAVTPEGLRWGSLLWTIVALTAVYACVRTFARREVAAASAMVIWAHPLVMMHAFEARFYGPMLAGTALAALALASRGHAAKFGLAAAAMLLCGVHYFGVIALMLMVAATVVTGQRKWKDVWPAGAGFVLTVACLPFYLGQRGSFAVTDWMEGVSARTVGKFFLEIAPPRVMLVVVVAVLLTFIGARKHRAPLANPLPASGELEKKPAALLALLAMPVVLIVVSLIAQPVIMGRYAIVFALGLAAGVAVVLRNAPRWALIATSAALLGVSCWEMHRLHQFQLAAAARIVLIADGIGQVGAGPAVFESGFDALPVDVSAEDLRGRVKMLEENLSQRKASRKADVVRAQMKNVTRWYGERAPKWITRDEAMRQRVIAYVPWEESAAPALPAGYVVTPVNPFVYVLERRE